MESTTPHNNRTDHRIRTLLDLVADTNAVVIFTRAGRPVSTLTPVEPSLEAGAILTVAQEDLFGVAPTIPADDA